MGNEMLAAILHRKLSAFLRGSYSECGVMGSAESQCVTWAACDIVALLFPNKPDQSDAY